MFYFCPSSYVCYENSRIDYKNSVHSQQNKAIVKIFNLLTDLCVFYLCLVRDVRQCFDYYNRSIMKLRTVINAIPIVINHLNAFFIVLLTLEHELQLFAIQKLKILIAYLSCSISSSLFLSNSRLCSCSAFMPTCSLATYYLDHLDFPNLPWLFKLIKVYIYYLKFTILILVTYLVFIRKCIGKDKRTQAICFSSLAICDYFISMTNGNVLGIQTIRSIKYYPKARTF